MADCKQIQVLIYLVLVTSANTENPEDPKRQAEIETLEKQKSELYKQINDAIDDSVKTLAENNDTDSKIGISLITDLKKKLEVLNGTELIDDFEIRNDTRRRGKKDGIKFRSDDDIYHRNKKGDKLFLDDLINKAQKSKKFRERLEHRIHMQNRIQDWLKKKADEKSKIKKYLYNGTLAGKKEKCYRYGVNKKRKTKRHKGWFPCCRKCCKKSYMGCL